MTSDSAASRFGLQSWGRASFFNATKTLIHGTVTSRLDYCNFLLCLTDIIPQNQD